MTRSPKKNGFALPMVIIALSGMVMLLMGLLAVVALERKTARSYADATRAEMALQSGLADALATITPIAARDDSLVFRLDDPKSPAPLPNDPTPQKFFTFGTTYDVSKKSWRILPFFSGMKEMQSNLTETGVNANASRPSGTEITNALSSLKIEAIGTPPSTERSAPQAVYVDLNDPAAATISAYSTRFAWWVEDLSGRVDGRHASSKDRIESLDPRESGLYTIFTPTADKDGQGPEDKLIEKRNSLRSSSSVRTVLDQADANKIEPWITYSQPETQRIAPLIPHGYGYADAGKPAQNLNELIAQRNVDAIAAHIDRNLPQWNTIRKGGFPATENYTKTLAASIIDYTDEDSDATTGPGYRGIDSYPFVNEIFDRYEWIGNSNGKVTVRVTTFIELWNLSQKKIKGDIQLENLNYHKFKLPPAAYHNFSPVTYTPPKIEMPANGFAVILCGFKDYEFPMGAFPPLPPLNFENTYTSTYKFWWNGTLVDTARGNVDRRNFYLYFGTSQRKWTGNASPAHDHSIGQHGDPRSSYYIRSTMPIPVNGKPKDGYIYAHDYDENSNWGGRALKQAIPNPNYREVKLTKWPDRGWESPHGKKPDNDAELPTALQHPANQPNMAPAFISNSEFLTTVSELGNIFDPAQWTAVDSPSGNPSAKSGGGFTLAIGRPEFAKFDQEGLRAAQLLDLFHAPNEEAAHLPKINVNTASREVLRTLIAGQELKLDPQQGSIFPPKQPNVGDRFADAVIETRKRGPLRGLSDLNLVRKNPNTIRNYTTPQADTEPFFGSREQYPQASRPPDTWDDAGREELFRRVSNLVSFQSKTFRIVVAGQVIDKSGKVIGKRMREFHVQIEPARNPDFTVDATKPVAMKVVYSRSL